MQLITNKFLRCCGVLLALGALALPVKAEEEESPRVNTISMVTYFPVKYASYANLYPTEKLDIGTMFSDTFELNIGSQGFKAGNVTLRAGSLQMTENFITNNTATFGKEVTSSGEVTLQFHNLYLGGVTGNKLSLTLTNSKLVANQNFNQITLFGKELPKCNGTLRWRKIKSKCYLVCCKPSGQNKDCSDLETCN